MKKNNILVSLSLIAAFFSTPLSFTASAPSSPRNFGPGFEIYNKASTIITVRLVIGGTTQTAMVLPQQKFEFRIDLNTPVRLELYDRGLTRQEVSSARPQRTVSISAPGKTKYLTWNPAKSPYLYPQTGPLMGLLGKSESGYPLAINLKQSDIR